MKKYLTPLAVLSVIIPATVQASGYRIPEQSVNATALSGAYTAHTPGADASYYNPANMTGFADQWQMAADLAYINLPEVTYTDNISSLRNGTSKEEEFIVPHLFAVSPTWNNLRFGVALTSPAGLSKRWADPFPRAYAEEFSLQVVELNPSVAWQANDKFSIGAGLRVLRADGVVKSYTTTPITASRDLEGDTTEYGFNLAASLKATEEFKLSITYRSKVDLGLEGDAHLIAGPSSYDGPARITVPVPAVLSIGAAYAIDKTIIEFAYDKTCWSKYENLDFNYSYSLLTDPYLAAFDAAIPKNWSDTNAFRIGVTHQINEQWTAMLGFAIDENPAPDNTLGFELPDSDAKIYSLGARYKYSDKLEIGAAYLYNDKDSRSITAAAANASTIDGTFDDGGAHIFTAGIQYSF